MPNNELQKWKLRKNMVAIKYRDNGDNDWIACQFTTKGGFMTKYRIEFIWKCIEPYTIITIIFSLSPPKKNHFQFPSYAAFCFAWMLSTLSNESISSPWIHYSRLWSQIAFFFPDKILSRRELSAFSFFIENWNFKTLGCNKNNHLFKYWIKYQYLWWWMVKECISFQPRTYFWEHIKKITVCIILSVEIKMARAKFHL